MSQEVVTLKSAVGAGGIPPSGAEPPDTSWVLDQLDTALANEGYPKPRYSAELRRVLAQSAEIALHRKNTKFTVSHVAYAIVFDNSEEGQNLTAHLKCDVESFCIGCVLHIMSLGASVGDAGVLPPAIATVRWIATAAEIARSGGGSAALRPMHLVQAIIERSAHPSVLEPLGKAARIGQARRDQLLGTRSPVIAPAVSGDIVEHMKAIAERSGSAGLEPLQASLIEIQTAVDAHQVALNRIDDQLGYIRSCTEPAYLFKENLAEMDQRIARLDVRVGQIDQFVAKADIIDQRVAGLVRNVEPIGQIIGRLGRIDRRVTAIEQGLPRPPSGLRLAAAIGAVLAIGVAAGLLLTQWQSSSRPEVRTASIERSR